MPTPLTPCPGQSSLLALLSHILLPSEPLPDVPSPPADVPGHLNLSVSQSELTVGLASSTGLAYTSSLILSPFLWLLCFSLANIIVFQAQHVSPALFWCRSYHALFAHLISTCSLDRFVWEGKCLPLTHWTMCRPCVLPWNPCFSSEAFPTLVSYLAPPLVVSAPWD